MFYDFCGVTTPTMDNFKVTLLHMDERRGTASALMTSVRQLPHNTALKQSEAPKEELKQ